MKVLIADDDEIQLAVLESFLQSIDFEVVKAHDGDEAYRLFQQESPQIVLLDWMMPGMEGVELCWQIRAESGDNYVYIIILTSKQEHMSMIEGLESGADDYIVKPYDPRELKVRLKTARRILSLETRAVTIFALAKLTESRDPETGQHLERMREFSRLLAQNLVDSSENLADRTDSNLAELIYLTSPLHDIGKVGIPDYVLLKPGRLTDDEFHLMKKHTTIGGETLDAAARQYPSVQYLKVARDIAWCHHERWDGSGYPRGLKGEEIPLAARIVALADVYDALTSKRVYKAAYNHDIAKQMIIEAKGHHFDPAVVDSFLACEAEFIVVKEKYSEDHTPACCE